MAHSTTDPVWQKIISSVTTAFLRVADKRTVSIWVASAFVAAYSGPFGTFQTQSLGMLFLIWLLLIGGAICLAYVINELCQAFLQSVSSLVFTAVFFGATTLAITTMVDLLLQYVITSGSALRPNWLELLAYSLAVLLTVYLIRRMIVGASTGMRESFADLDKVQKRSVLPAHTRLAKRLDIPEGVRIICICADGHFVEVYTTSEKYRLRMRFSDAIEELDETIGLTVHRSHWVHLDAVKGWVPSARKPFVLMDNGIQIPVSKTYFDRVTRAGLLELDGTELLQEA